MKKLASMGTLRVEGVNIFQSPITVIEEGLLRDEEFRPALVEST